MISNKGVQDRGETLINNRSLCERLSKTVILLQLPLLVYYYY